MRIKSWKQRRHERWLENKRKHLWFAWYPVYFNGYWVWLEILVRWIVRYGNSWAYDYVENKNDED